MIDVAGNLARVSERIREACERAGRAAGEVRLVAVSKKQPDERLLAAYQAGHRDFGENYVQELVRKKALLPDDARWHGIGHIQRNKAKGAASADLIHTLDSERLARALDKVVVGAGTVLPVLIEVNTAEEGSKTGVPPDGVEPLLAAVASLEHLEVRGLMCIPPIGDGRRHFAALPSLRDRVAAAAGVSLPELSMGMSADFEEAIAEGATIVRVGTAIFGER